MHLRVGNSLLHLYQTSTRNERFFTMVEQLNKVGREAAKQRERCTFRRREGEMRQAERERDRG